MRATKLELKDLEEEVRATLEKLTRLREQGRIPKLIERNVQETAEALMQARNALEIAAQFA